MLQIRIGLKRSRAAAILFISALLIASVSEAAVAHPLGNFTINHFAQIEARSDRITIRYVLDMAEIPAFQEMQLIDADGDGNTSGAELDRYLERASRSLGQGLMVTVDGAAMSLVLLSKSISTPPGAGGLPTLRIECSYSGEVRGGSRGTRRVRFENTNYQERLGWREMVVSGASGVAVFDSTAYGSGVSDELRSYPEDLLAAPLDERVAEFSFGGFAPPDSKTLLMRDGRPASQSRDRLAELIAVPEVTWGVALIGLLVAAALGGVHALSPGHGKTVVGAYLVGSRGTARHALFLGLTVTITHTVGVFALGLVTLVASEYILPEKLYPVLSLASGGVVLVIGMSLFIRRIKAAMAGGVRSHHHEHDHAHPHDHGHNHYHAHHHDGMPVHTHGGRAHSHLPPGGDGSGVTWRSLLALGISGGLLPCPSALVVLLSAISLNRVGYGLVLVVAFSVGLAATLTAVGLLFVYAGRLMKGSLGAGRLARALPVVSAFFITCAGLAICYEALLQAGVKLWG
jgi:ABC-type nickel/cobalt efflux system permease component RcnA